VKKRTVATLGRADQAGDKLESVIRGLQRLRGDAPPDASAVATVADVRFESSRALGDVWALTELWDELGFGELRRVFGRTRSRIDVEALVRLMVINRLCDPTCLVPDDWLLNNRRGLLMGREVLRAVLAGSSVREG